MIGILQKKFVITAMIAVSVLLLLLLGAINIANIAIVGNEVDRTLQMIAKNQIKAENSAPPPEPMMSAGSPKNDYDTFMSSNFFVVCFDADGKTVRCDVSRTSSVTEAEAVNMAYAVIENGKTEGRDGKFRYAVQKERSDGRTAVFLDTSDEIFSYIRVLLLSAALGAICWMGMLFIVVLLSKRAIRPIAENIERQKQFVTNAGHEIKTPLAIIRSNTDAMELYNGENKWSRNIREQTERLDGLMKNLLMLSRMDEGIYNIHAVRFSLSVLIERIMCNFLQLLERKDVNISTDIQQTVEIDADEGSIEQLVSILLENAVKYVNGNGYISVSLHKSEKTVKMQIKNSCEKLPEAPPDKLFERFYRDDAARTQKSGGYGIGLSAARAVVNANKGEIYAEYIQPNIICFTVVFKCHAGGT